MAHGVSPSPAPEERAERIEKGVRVKGESVCLFQSGTADVRNEIQVNDTLVVLREDAQHGFREVGSVRVLSYKGDDYLRAEVAAGEVRAGDVAKKGGAASLVIFSEERCR
jgi:hypothetical protein